MIVIGRIVGSAGRKEDCEGKLISPDVDGCPVKIGFSIWNGGMEVDNTGGMLVIS